MNAKDSLLNAYYAVEDRWFDLLDWLDKKNVPVYKLVDPIEKHGIPSLPVFTAVLLLTVYLLGGVFSGFPGGGPGEVPVSIQVVDQQMAHVSKAGLIIHDSSGQLVFNGTANEEGLLEIKLLAGEYTVSASAEGCSPNTQTITVSGEESTPFSISLDCQASKPVAKEVTLCVKSDQDEALGKVFYKKSGEITKGMCGQGECTLLVNSGESYVFSSETDRYEYSAEYTGEHILGLENSPESNCITLKGTAKPLPKGEVCVDVYQPDGKNLIPYAVNVKLVNPEDTHDVLIKKNTLEGTACMEIEQHTPFKVEISPDAHAYYLSNETYTLNETVPQLHLNATLKDAAETLFVVKAGLNPLTGVYVKVIDAHGVLQAQGYTDANGRLVRGLTRGEEYVATFYKKGYRTRQIEITGGKSYTVNMTQVPASEYGSLSVLALYQEDNASVTGATVTLYNYNQSIPTEYAAPSMKTGPGGTVFMSWIDPGTYCVKVSKGSSNTECGPDTTVTITAGKKEYLTVYLESQKIDVVVFASSETTPARGAKVLLSSVLGKESLTTDTQGKAVFRNSVRKDSVFDVHVTWTDPNTGDNYFKDIKRILAEKDTELHVQLEKPGTNITAAILNRAGEKTNSLQAGSYYYLSVSHGELAEYNSSIIIRMPREVKIDVYGATEKYYNKTTGKIILSYPSPENDTVTEHRIMFRIRRGSWTKKQGLKITYHGEWKKQEYTAKDPARGEKELQFNVTNTINLFKENFAIKAALLDANGNTYLASQVKPGDELIFYALLTYEGDQTFKQDIKIKPNKNVLSLHAPSILCPGETRKEGGELSEDSAVFSEYCSRSADPNDYGVSTGETIELWAPFTVKQVLKNNTDVTLSLEVGGKEVAFQGLTIVTSKIICKNPEEYNKTDWENGLFVCDESNGLMERSVILTDGATYPAWEKPKIDFDQEFSVITTIAQLPGYESKNSFSISMQEDKGHVKFSRTSSVYDSNGVIEYTKQSSEDGVTADIKFVDASANYSLTAYAKGWLPGDAVIKLKKDDTILADGIQPALVRVTKENLPGEQCIGDVCVRVYEETETSHDILPQNIKSSQVIGNDLFIADWLQESEKGLKVRSASVSVECSGSPQMSIGVLEGGRHLEFKELYSGKPEYSQGAYHLTAPQGVTIPTGAKITAFAINFSCTGQITGDIGEYETTVGGSDPVGPVASITLSQFKETPNNIMLKQGKKESIALDVSYYGQNRLTDPVKVSTDGMPMSFIEEANDKITAHTLSENGTKVSVSESNIDKTSGSILNTISEFNIKRYSTGLTEEGIGFRDKLIIMAPAYAIGSGASSIQVTIGSATFHIPVEISRTDYGEEAECNWEKGVCWKMWVENPGKEKAYDATKTVYFTDRPVLKANVFPSGDLSLSPSLQLKYDGSAIITTDLRVNDAKKDSVLSIKSDENNKNSYTASFVSGGLSNLTISLEVTPVFYGDLHYTLMLDGIKLGEYYRKIGGNLYPELNVQDADKITEFSDNLSFKLTDKTTRHNLAQDINKYINKVTLSDENGRNRCTLTAADLQQDDSGNIKMDLNQCWQNYGAQLFSQGKKDKITAIVEVNDSDSYQKILELKDSGNLKILYALLVIPGQDVGCTSESADTLLDQCGEYLRPDSQAFIQTGIETESPTTYSELQGYEGTVIKHASISEDDKLLCVYPSTDYPDASSFIELCKQDYSMTDIYREHPFKQLFDTNKKYTLAVESKVDENGQPYFRRGEVDAQINVLACLGKNTPKGVDELKISVPTDDEQISLEAAVIQQCKDQGVGIEDGSITGKVYYYIPTETGKTEKVNCLKEGENPHLSCMFVTAPYAEDSDGDGHNDNITYDIAFNTELSAGESRQGNFTFNFTLSRAGLVKTAHLTAPFKLMSKTEQGISTTNLQVVPTEYGDFEKNTKMSDIDKINCTAHVCNLRQTISTVWTQNPVFNTVYYSLIPEEMVKAYDDITEEIINTFNGQVEIAGGQQNAFAVCDTNKEPFAAYCFTGEANDQKCLPEIGTGEFSIETIPVQDSESKWNALCYNTQHLSEFSDTDLQERFAMFLPIDLESAFAKEDPEVYNTLVTITVPSSKEEVKGKVVNLLKSAWGITDKDYPSEYISMTRDVSKSQAWQHELIVEVCQQEEDKACQDLVKHMGTEGIPAGALPAVYVDSKHKVHIVGTSVPDVESMLNYLTAYFDGNPVLYVDGQHEIVLPRKEFDVWINKDIPEDNVKEKFNQILLKTLELEDLKDIKIEYTEPGKTPFSNIIGWIDYPSNFNEESLADYKAKFSDMVLNANWGLPEDTATIWEGSGRMYLSVPEGENNKPDEVNNILNFAMSGKTEEGAYARAPGKKLLAYKFKQSGLPDLIKRIEDVYKDSGEKTYALDVEKLPDKNAACTGPVESMFKYAGVDKDNNALTSILPGKVILYLKEEDSQESDTQEVNEQIMKEIGVNSYAFPDKQKSKIVFWQVSSKEGEDAVIPRKTCTWFLDPEPRAMLKEDETLSTTRSDPTAVFVLNSYPTEIIVPTQYKPGDTEISNFELGATSRYHLVYDMTDSAMVPIKQLEVTAYDSEGNQIDSDVCTTGDTCKITPSQEVSYVTVTAIPESGAGAYMFIEDGFIRAKYGSKEFPLAGLGYTDLSGETNPGWVSHLYTTKYRVGLRYLFGHTSDPNGKETGEPCGSKYTGKCEEHKDLLGNCKWGEVKRKSVYCEQGAACYYEANRRCDDTDWSSCHTIGDGGICISCGDGEFPRMGALPNEVYTSICTSIPSEQKSFGEEYTQSTVYNG